MADNTKIEWTDATWNPITGCSVVSPGCTNCYAMKLAGTRLAHHPSRSGLTRDTRAGPVWTGEVRFNEQWLDQPLRWRRPRMIFVCAHGDLFAEGVPDGWIDRVFAVMALARHHTFQVLTKRPSRAREYLDGYAANVRIERLLDAMKPSGLWNGNVVEAAVTLDSGQPLPNVWLGVSVEDQRRADERIPILLDTPAAIRWISAEPLLGPIDPTALSVAPEHMHGFRYLDALDGGYYSEIPRPAKPPHPVPGVSRLDWVVAGGESGHDARPMHPDWARSLRDQCQAAGVPFLFKQWGEWGPDEGMPAIGADRIMEGRARCAAWTGDAWRFERSGYDMPLDGTGREWVYRLGKKAAGRLLDGREWNEFPEVRQ